MLQVVLEAIKLWEHLTIGDLVVDVGHPVEHLVVVRRGGVWAHTVLYLMG